MIAAVALLSYAALVGSLVPGWLCRAQWRLRSPRLALAGWGLLLFSVLSSLVLAGLLLAAPDTRITASLADLVHACVQAVDQAYSAPGDASLHLAGAVLALAVLSRVLVGFAVLSWRTSKERSRHLQGLRLIAREGPAQGVLVLDHDVPAAYCIGGRRGAVVVTSAVLAKLDDDELTAVLAHEYAHRSGKHHLVLTVVRALACSVPGLPVARRAVAAVSELLEMSADDAAVDRVGADATRAALLKVADPRPGPATATLAAAGTAVSVRIQRLRQTPRRMHAFSSSVLLGTGLCIAVLPVLVAAAPASTAIEWNYCPLS